MNRAAGALTVVVAVQLSDVGLYFPPVSSTRRFSSIPPQTIISLPVHTAVCTALPLGASVVLVGVQVSVAGPYFPPVSNTWNPHSPSWPPQTIISLPVQTAV